jgi:6-phosphogluconolactonase (cycloisomerase 2 family)
MHINAILLGVFTIGCARAVVTNLYVASYSGVVTSLSLHHNSNGTYSLQKLSSTNGSAPNPSWLTLDNTNQILYATDEGLNAAHGTVVSFKVDSHGQFKEVARVKTLVGCVNSGTYGDGTALAVAH